MTDITDGDDDNVRFTAAGEWMPKLEMSGPSNSEDTQASASTQELGALKSISRTPTFLLNGRMCD
jgi:hypothetical protein